MTKASILASARGESRTQEQIAEQLNVTQATVSHWETCAAAPHPEQWKAIAKVYGISLARLAEHFSNVKKAS